MADGGQGFLKVCLSVLDNDSLQETELNKDDFETSPKRTSYSEEGSTSCAAKATSVKRLYMLCIVPDVTKSYHNLDVLFNLMNINKISFKFGSGFKLMLIVNRQQTASSS